MRLQQQIKSFIEKPFPLWENELTTQLVKAEWDSLRDYNIVLENYSTAKAYCKDGKLQSNTVVKIFGEVPSDSIFLEYPQPQLLGDFYENTGLELLDQKEIETVNGIEKIKCALETLGKVPGVLDCISQLVKCIGILRQHDSEIDTSHSDPDIPFSIFVSVCEDTSEISNLRVAESILHEAMHLKLTMIEHHVDLIIPDANETFYSPWRDEQRPVRGVLHGLFVFSAVKIFYIALMSKFAKARISEIENDFKLLKKLKEANGLTQFAKSLTKLLLKI